jgi:hypothetical protein
VECEHRYDPGRDRESGDRERPAVQGDPATDVDAERASERALDHHPAEASMARRLRADGAAGRAQPDGR